MPLGHGNWARGTPVDSGWTGNLRIALGWQHSMHHEFGMLADDCAAVLKNSLLYQRNEAFIITLQEARLAFGDGHYWSGPQLVSHPQRFDDRWSDDRSGLEFRSEADIRAYFESAPELIGAHPIKFSRVIFPSVEAGN